MSTPRSPLTAAQIRDWRLEHAQFRHNLREREQAQAEQAAQQLFNERLAQRRQQLTYAI